MKVRIILMAFVCLLLSSCSSVYQTSAPASVDTHIYSMAVADLDISGTKMQKTYSWSFNPFKRVNIETVKSNVTAEMLQECDADVLVEPEYIVKKNGLFEGGSVTVIGFPAKYTGFHTATPEEAKIIEVMTAKGKKEQAPRKRFLFF